MPISNTQYTIFCVYTPKPKPIVLFDTQKNFVFGIGYGYDTQKIVYWVLDMGIGMIPKNCLYLVRVFSAQTYFFGYQTNTQCIIFLGIIPNT